CGPQADIYGSDGTVVRLSAPGAVLQDVAHQVAHVVLQIPDDVLDDVSDRDHAHDLARVQHWQMAKIALSHHCHAALQPIVRLDRHRVARHHLAHRRLLRIEPGQQHFDGAVTLGHNTDQHVVVDDQHRPDPVVAHLAQGFDDHFARTNMDQVATLLGQSGFYCGHRISSRGPCPGPPKWYALKVRAGSFSVDHNLAHHTARATQLAFEDAGSCHSSVRN